MRVIAFYTKDTPYEKEAEIWQESFKTCKTAIYVMENQKSWEENCALKSTVLLRALEDYEDDLLYVDIDARLMRPLPVDTLGELPGLCFWNRWSDGVRELCSGTIYLPNNDSSKVLLETWNRYQKYNPKVWDQKVLQHVVETKDFPYIELDHDWISISGHIQRENPIIHHTQASRRLKKIVNTDNRLLQ